MKSKNLFSKFAFAALAVMVSLSMASCDKDDDGNGGNDDNDGNGGGTTKVDPSSVAASSLVAYFPFESETATIEKGAGVTFSEKIGAASFTKGRRGNAYTGSTSESYLAYDVASDNLFKNLKSYTIAAWIKAPATTSVADILVLNGGDSFMGNLALTIEGNSNVDSLDVKVYLYSSATEWQGQDLRIQNPAFTTDRWFHLISSYDAATSTMALYSNATLVSSSVRYAGPEVDGQQPLMGDLVLASDMTKLFIGAWPQLVNGNAEDYMKFYSGQVDELRIYDKALTETEIKALYDAEVENID